MRLLIVTRMPGITLPSSPARLKRHRWQLLWGLEQRPAREETTQTEDPRPAGDAAFRLTHQHE